MKAIASARSTAAGAEQQLETFIDKFDPKHGTLIRAVRRALRKRLPTAHELIIRSISAKQRPRRK